MPFMHNFIKIAEANSMSNVQLEKIKIALNISYTSYDKDEVTSINIGKDKDCINFYSAIGYLNFSQSMRT